MNNQQKLELATYKPKTVKEEQASAVMFVLTVVVVLTLLFILAVLGAM